MFMALLSAVEFHRERQTERERKKRESLRVRILNEK